VAHADRRVHFFHGGRMSVLRALSLHQNCIYLHSRETLGAGGLLWKPAAVFAQGCEGGW
jgi:hypothetical protein